MSVERSIFSHSEKGSQMCSGEKFNGQKIQRLSFLDTGWCLEESSWLSNLGIKCHAKVLFNFIVLTGMDAFGFFRWRIKQSGWNNDERGIPTTSWTSLKKQHDDWNLTQQDFTWTMNFGKTSKLNLEWIQNARIKLTKTAPLCYWKIVGYVKSQVHGRKPTNL